MPRTERNGTPRHDLPTMVIGWLHGIALHGVARRPDDIVIVESNQAGGDEENARTALGGPLLNRRP